MTIDEAIKHCEEVAEKNRELFEKIGTNSYDEVNCLECAREHEQLAEWLKELKRHREAWEKVKAEIVERTKHLDEHNKEDMRELVGILSILASITEHLQEVTDA